MVPAKLLIVTLLATESALVYAAFGDLAIAGFLAASAAWFLLDAVLLFGARPYSVSLMRLFFLGWNAVAFGSMHWVWARGTFAAAAAG